jgi:hypothetical protein
VPQRVSALARAPRTAFVALVGLTLAAAVVYSLLTRLLTGPHVFGDELDYSEAGTSLAQGRGLQIRGEAYGYGPAYPVVLALIRLTAADQPSAYWRWLAANGVFVALTALPAYVLARRLLRPWPSVLVGGLTAGVPSAFYATAVMTECLGYLVAAVGVASIVLAVEEPTLWRQATVIWTTALATEVRPQFAVLFVAFVIAVAVAWWIAPSPRSELRPLLMRLWPTITVALIVIIVPVAIAAGGGSPSSLLGSYKSLARAYPVGASLKWGFWHLFDLSLYLGLLGFVPIPFALASIWRRARAGSIRDTAFLGTFVGVNLTAFAVVATFSTSQFGLGRLHDRYLFYVVPLWLVALVAWIVDGAPRSRRWAAAVTVAFVVFVVAMPYGRLVVLNGGKMFDGTGTAVPARLGALAGQTDGLMGRWGLVGAALLAGVWLLYVPRRFAWTAVLLVAASFVAGGAIMWQRQTRSSGAPEFADSSAATRGWVDASVPKNADVTLLSTQSGACLDPYTFLYTEFFNGTIRRVPYLGKPLEYGPPTHPVHVERDGALVNADGKPFVARYLVAPAGIPVAGRELAVGTNRQLVLWETSGSVRIPGATSDAVVERACT